MRAVGAMRRGLPRHFAPRQEKRGPGAYPKSRVICHYVRPATCECAGPDELRGTRRHAPWGRKFSR